MDDKTQTEIEAAAFRGLVEQVQRRTDEQNIDILNVAGYFSICLSMWYLSSAKHRGVDMDYDQATEAVYGMPYGELKKKYQK